VCIARAAGLLCALLSAACSSDDGADSNGPASPGPGRQVTLRGSAVLYPSMDPNEGVRVCRRGSSEGCVTTDTAGEFQLPVAAAADVAVTFQKEGQLSILVAIQTGDTDLELRPMAYTAPLADVDAIAATLAAPPWDRQKGLVDLALFDTGTLDFTPRSGAGPFSSPALGLTVFVNIDPGEVEFTVQGTSGACSFSDLLWRGTAPGSVRLPIQHGFLTRLMAVTCQAGAESAE
jgi:hypothetical protein